MAPTPSAEEVPEATSTKDDRVIFDGKPLDSRGWEFRAKMLKDTKKKCSPILPLRITRSQDDTYLVTADIGIENLTDGEDVGTLVRSMQNSTVQCKEKTIR